MALLKEYFYNIECDHCHALANEEMWNNEPVRDDIIPCDEHWQHLGGKDYCPKCWHWDDDDHIVTADGKVWDEDTEEEIKEE